jgi:GTP-binding protein
VVLASSPNLADLSFLGRRKEFAAQNGRRGSGGRKKGKRGEDLVVTVPVGTMVFVRPESGQETLLADLRAAGQQVLVAKGGRGGLGNARFVTPVRQAPEIAGLGQLGEKWRIIIEVKLVTDICIVGPPNSGKSTLLSAMSRARPRIADYPFTTRQPVLGVIPGEERDYIIAEIPGLVGGAHLGKGLGNDFLRHAERTKLLVYLLDGSSPTVVDDLATLDKEISLFKSLSLKPRIVAVNKVDLPEVRARLPALKQGLARLEVPVFYISAVSGEAVLELTRKAMEMVQGSEPVEETTWPAQIAVFHPRPRKQKA